MKAMKTAVVGSCFALAGAAVLSYHGSLVRNAMICVQAETTAEGGSWLRNSAWLASRGASVFFLGTAIAIGGTAYASRFGGVLVGCRKLILLAGAIAIGASVPMLLSTGALLRFALDVIGATDPPSFIRSHAPPSAGLLYVSFALLLPVAACLFCASWFGVGRTPPTRLNRWIGDGAGLAVVAIMAFGGALGSSFESVMLCCDRIAWAEPSDTLARLHSIAVAQFAAAGALLAFGIANIVFAVLLRLAVTEDRT